MMCTKLLSVGLFLLYMSTCNEARITEVVNRRRLGDIFKYFNSSGRSVCSDNNELNYLVSEEECVTNQELLNSKSDYNLCSTAYIIEL